MSKSLFPIFLALALAGVLGAGSLPTILPTILPTRRRAFEPGFDLNRGLFDPGKCRERQLRKQGRQQRLRELQAQAITKGNA